MTNFRLCLKMKMMGSVWGEPKPVVTEQMRFRLAAAASASCRLRCLAVRLCAARVAPFPGPRACVGHADRETGAVSPARDSACARRRRRPRSGASSTISISLIELDTFALSCSATSIDIIVIFGTTPSSIQTLPFHFFRP